MSAFLAPVLEEHGGSLAASSQPDDLSFHAALSIHALRENPHGR